MFRNFNGEGYDGQWVNGSLRKRPVTGRDLGKELGPHVAALCHKLKIRPYTPDVPCPEEIFVDVQQVFSDFESGDFPEAYAKYRH